MDNVLSRKLQRNVEIDDEDRRFLHELTSASYTVEPGMPLEHAGEPRSAQLILEGVASKYKVLPNGRRQILAYMVPGDFCDLHGHVLDRRDHEVAAVSMCRFAVITPQRVAEMIERPKIGRAVWRSTLDEVAILREWLVNIGSRDTQQRIGHFFCEMFLRLEAVGLTEGNECTLPLTQTDLADTLGVSLVHTNRNLQALRERRLVAFNRSRLSIPDFKALEKFSLFDRTYLGPGGRDAELDGKDASTSPLGLRFLGGDRDPKSRPSA